MIEIIKATSSDAADILAFTKVCGSETDNLSFDGDGIPITVEQEESYLKSIEQSTSKIYFSWQKMAMKSSEQEIILFFLKKEWHIEENWKLR